MTQNRGRWLAIWIMTGLITLIFMASAITKLIGFQPVAEMFREKGLGSYLSLIGFGELISALLFLIPRTNSLGLLLLSAYLGGAIATHMQHSEPFLVPSVLLLLVWATGYIRHPEMLQSFRLSKA